MCLNIIKRPRMKKIEIGKILNATGLKGEVKVYSYAESPERFEKSKYVYVEDVKTKVQKVRYQKNLVILKLEGIDDRNASEAVKNKILYLDETDLEKLPEGRFYIKDLIGLDVLDENNEKIGIVENILKNTAQDLYEIELLNSNMVYIPGVSEFISDINPERGYVKIKTIEGLLEVNYRNED